MLVTGTFLLTYTTSPILLTDGLESLLNPLKKIGLPIHELAMIMSIALRFIPTLIQETDKIIKAQEARGADFESGNLLQRAKSLIPILVPLFVSSFRIAQDLALAMEARCYRGGAGRTKMKPLVYKKQDKMAYVILFVFLAVVIVLVLAASMSTLSSLVLTSASTLTLDVVAPAATNKMSEKKKIFIFERRLEYGKLCKTEISEKRYETFSTTICR